MITPEVFGWFKSVLGEGLIEIWKFIIKEISGVLGMNYLDGWISIMQ